MKKKTFIKIGVISSAIIIAVTTILIKMFTLPADIEFTKTINTPDLPVVSELITGDYREKATAVDGRIIQGTSGPARPTASTAKMILGLAVMKEKPFPLGSKGETITITLDYFNKYIWYNTHNGSTTRVLIGEEISQYDALASIFLASSNNMADTLAIWTFGSLEGYQSYATSMLQEMGIINTTIGIDASGYSETTTSTAEDLARIAAELLKDPVLREIVSLKTHVVPVAGELKNTNQILGESLENNRVILGVKTGYIGDISGYNLVSAYELDSHFVTEALLGASTRQGSFISSKEELQKLSREVNLTTISDKNQPVGYYETWWNGRHEIYADEELKILGIQGDSLEIDLSENELKATLNGEEATISTHYESFLKSPSIWERFLHVFGWTYK